MERTSGILREQQDRARADEQRSWQRKPRKTAAVNFFLPRRKGPVEVHVDDDERLRGRKTTTAPEILTPHEFLLDFVIH